MIELARVETAKGRIHYLSQNSMPASLYWAPKRQEQAAVAQAHARSEPLPALQPVPAQRRKSSVSEPLELSVFSRFSAQRKKSYNRQAYAHENTPSRLDSREGSISSVTTSLSRSSTCSSLSNETYNSSRALLPTAARGHTIADPTVLWRCQMHKATTYHPAARRRSSDSSSSEADLANRSTLEEKRDAIALPVRCTCYSWPSEDKRHNQVESRRY